jgi:hypothetical protein
MAARISRSAYRAGVWFNSPAVEHLYDPTVAVQLYENWQNYDPEATNGEWVLTQATAGTAAVSTAAPGTLLLDSDSTTVTQGVQLQRVKSPFVPASGKDIWAEFQFKIVDTFDKVELFVGLAEIDTSVLAASAVSTSNHIGWQCVTDDGVLLFDTEKATAAATAAAATIAEDTWIKLGFYYDGTADTLTQYVNGVATGSAVATANIPKVALYPTFVCQSAGTNDPIMHIRPFRVMQLL